MGVDLGCAGGKSVSTFVSALQYKSAKVRQCDFCGEIIARGETYTRNVCADGGSISAAPFHPECQAVLKPVHEDAEYTRFGMVRGVWEER